MKKLLYSIVMLILLVFFTECKDDAVSDTTDTTPCPPPELLIKNDSEFTLNQVLLHNRQDYLVLGVIPPQVVIATDMLSNTEITIDTIINNDSKYITFIRNITTGSSQEYAFTTSDPIVFKECRKYIVHILEEDFLLNEEDSKAK